MRDVLLILGVLAITWRSFWSPSFGAMAYIGISLLNPNSWTWGFAQFFPSAEFIAIATLAGFGLFHENKSFPMRTETKLMLFLWVTFALTTIDAESPHWAQFKLKHMSKVLLMVFMTLPLIDTAEKVGQLVRVVAYCLGFHGLNTGLFVILTGGAHRVWGPENSFLHANNMIGLALAMNVPMLWYQARLERRWYLKAAAYSMMFLSYPAVVATFSRGAWLGLAASTMYIVLRSRYRLVLGVLAVAIGIAILPFLPDTVTNRYDDLVNYEEESSAQSRFWNWTFAWHVFKGNPITGAGFSYYSLDAYEKYYPEFLDAWPGKVWSPHSVWFSMISEHGAMGFLTWVSMLLVTIFTCLKIRRRSLKEGGPRWLTTYAEMIPGVFFSFMVSGSFLDAQYFDNLYQLVAVTTLLSVIGLPLLGKDPDAEATAAEPEKPRFRVAEPRRPTLPPLPSRGAS